MTKGVLRVIVVGLILVLAVPLLSSGTATTYAEPAGPPTHLQRVGPQPDGTTIQYQPRGLGAQKDDSPRYVFLKMRGAPLAQVYAARKAAGTGLMSAELQRSYVQRLELAQQQVVAGAKALGVQVISTYQKVLNGVQVKARPSQFDALLALPGVESIHPVALMEPLLGDSVPHIGAQRVIDELGIDGTDVDIGIIDTGIDYIHANFGGPATEEAYAANDNTVITDTFQNELLFPTAKVVGGWDFVGELYDAGCSEEDEEAGICTSTPQPDPDPMDDGNHGTHVAGIVAGLGTDEVPHGVAPGARLWALKVFGAEGSTNVTADSIEWAIDPNDDGDISDALDVINMSLGCPYSCGAGIDEETLAEVMAIENAVAAGMVVVASAGNEGDVPFITGAPAAITPAISVASSYAPGEVRLAVEVLTPEAVSGLYEAAEAAFTPPLDEVGPVEGELAYIGRGCPANGGPEDPYLADPNGKVAMIDRGRCRFDAKIKRAEEAGAIAVVMVNNVDGPPIVMGGDPIVNIPAVMISKADGDTIKAAEDTVTVRLDAETTIPRPDLTDQISGFSSRGPAWRVGDVAAGESSILLKPEITAPGSNIVSSLAGTGTGGAAFSGTSMSSPHVAGVAALIKQAHPNWTPEQVKSAIMGTALSPIYIDGNPEFGGGGTIAPASLMGAGLVDAFAAISSDVFVLGDQGASVDFGFQNLSEATSLSREVTIRNDGDMAVTYEVSFDFQDADDADAGVTVGLSSNVLTVPASGTATVELSVDIDPTTLKDWPLSGGSSMGSGDALRDIEYSGWLTLTPAGGGLAQAAGTLSAPVYLLPRKSADIAAATTSLTLEEFGPENAVSFDLVNASSIPGTAEVFTLAGQDPNEDGGADALDVQAVGVRNTPVEDLGNVLEFAFATYAPRNHPVQVEFDIFIDVDQDRTADYLLVNNDLGVLLGQGCCDGRNVTALFDLATGSGVLEFFTETDLFTTNIDLPVLAEDMGLSGDNLTFDYWVAVFDNFTGDLVDVLPDDAFSTPARYTFDGAHPLYVVDQPSVEVVDSQTISVYADALGAPAQPSAEGLLALYSTGPTNQPFDIIEISFEYEAGEIVIEADRAATGFVNSKNVTGSSLGGSRMWTGVTIGNIRWYGVTQFELTTDLPSGARIIEAELDLTGQEAKYLNEAVDATWTVELLDESIDSAWPDVKYYMVHLAPVDATLSPAVRDEDLGAGVVNVFRLDGDDALLIEQRIATTGRASFRTNMVLDPLHRFFSGRHLFGWDGGGGVHIPGEQPPVLRIKYVAAR